MPRNAATAPPPVPQSHGRLRLPAVVVNNYSLQLRHGEDFLGDTVCRAAFYDMLDAWRKLFRSIHGVDSLGDKPTEEISKKRLDAQLKRKAAAAATIYSALEDYAVQLAHVVRRFLRHESWRGVERIVIGGGFKQSAVGEQAVRRAAELLFQQGESVQLRTLRHHADEGGLIGWVHLVHPELLKRYDALLAVDVGGTNVRCGIVRPRAKKALDLSKVDVVGRTKWGHAEDKDATTRKHLVQGIAGMLEELIAQAKRNNITLAPFVGMACPGLIRKDGTIASGAQNLPGDWENANFRLARHLQERLPRINGQKPEVRMHNDAVVQGLSELPSMTDVKRWAILTVGTGLGNASYTNR